MAALTRSQASLTEPLLVIENLSISFFTRAGEIPAVMDFSATVEAGRALGLVGESGCGKSTVALAVMRDLGKTGRIVGGSIRFKGRELTTMPEAELLKEVTAHGFSVRNLTYRLAAEGTQFEYRMVLRSMNEESARALSDALRANRAVLEYRIAPTSD